MTIFAHRGDNCDSNETKGLQEVLSAAIKHATDEKILVSFVKQIDWMDPLLFYAAGKRISFENRCYFADPAQHVIFAGIGSVFTIATASHKRFQTARDEWDKVKEKSFVQREKYEFGTYYLFIWWIFI